MVDVGVAQNHCGQSAHIEWKVAIALDRFSAAALKKTAFQQETLLVDLEEIHRTCRRAGSAEKMNSHEIGRS
jgi:hypothetical protein